LRESPDGTQNFKRKKEGDRRKGFHNDKSLPAWGKFREQSVVKGKDDDKKVREEGWFVVENKKGGKKSSRVRRNSEETLAEEGPLMRVEFNLHILPARRGKIRS